MKLSRRRQSPAVNGPPGLFAAAIFGPLYISHEFELPTMEARCHRLFIDISVPSSSASACDLDTEYKPRSSLHEHAKGRGWLS